MYSIDPKKTKKNRRAVCLGFVPCYIGLILISNRGLKDTRKIFIPNQFVNIFIIIVPHKCGRFH